MKKRTEVTSARGWASAAPQRFLKDLMNKLEPYRDIISVQDEINNIKQQLL